MTGKLKIGLLCNHIMALPALQRMAADGHLCFVASTDTSTEAKMQIERTALGFHVPFHLMQGKGRDRQLSDLLASAAPDVVFVMTWPWRIPAALLAVPKLGFFNFHYGLLPEMRGADPIFESIRQRKQNAGATVHKMDEQLDTGPIVLREQIPLRPSITYGMLSSQMAVLGDKMCAQLIIALQDAKELVCTPQEETSAKYWPKVGTGELSIRWEEMSQQEIAALVRACNPVIKGVPVKLNQWNFGISDVTEMNLQGDASAIKPGTILAVDPQNGLIVCCKDGTALKLEVVYTAEGNFPGYKLASFGIQPGMVLSNVI